MKKNASTRHDFAEPLTILKLQVALLQQQIPLDSPHQKSLQHMTTALKSLEKIGEKLWPPPKDMQE